MIETSRYVQIIDNINKLTAELNEKSKTWKCLKTLKNINGIYFIKGKLYHKLEDHFNGELVLLDEENERHVIGREWEKYFTVFL